jgi:hypothetical protein
MWTGYLPIDCPACGDGKLEAALCRLPSDLGTIEVHSIVCEKCGRDDWDQERDPYPVRQRPEPASSGETWAKGFCAGEDQAVEMLGESGHYAAAKWLRSRLSRERAKEAKDARASVVEASPAKEVLKRGEHRGGSLGPCSRCGRSREDRSGLCPPAYWMTEKELRRWESALSAITRSRMEETLGRAPEAS